MLAYAGMAFRYRPQATSALGIIYSQHSQKKVWFTRKSSAFCHRTMVLSRTLRNFAVKALAVSGVSALYYKAANHSLSRSRGGDLIHFSECG